ncbi:MAG TPA: hypothetical protein VNI78_09680, partial [Vicinamibacterales bacterium]|nr:hypothetical protein [Vicinamibacterales bacterium]
PAWIAGFAAGAEAVVIFPGRARLFPYDSPESVLRHEIAHLALTARAGGRPLPRWFHEGVAISVETGWDVLARLHLLVLMLGRPDLDDVGRLFASRREQDVRLGYLLSAALVHHLRQEHGQTMPGEIAGRVAGGVPFDRAFAMETGTTPDAAAARTWRTYRQWIAWVPAVTSPTAVWTAILLLAFVAYLAQRRRRLRRRHAWDREQADAAD